MKKRKLPEPTKAERFRAAAKKFAISNKTAEDVNSIVVAGWVAMRQGEGLVFEEVRLIIKEEMDGAPCARNEWCVKSRGHGDGCSSIGD